MVASEVAPLIRRFLVPHIKPGSARDLRQQAAERAGYIAALGWQPEPEGARLRGEDYAASASELHRWVIEDLGQDVADRIVRAAAEVA